MIEPARPPRGAGPLGILACAGRLPVEIAEAAARRGRAVHVVAIEGFAGQEIARFPHEAASLGQVDRILASFARAGTHEIVIAGAMQRPNLLAMKIDRGFLRHLPVVLSLTRGGDDNVLRRVVRFFEAQGLTVVGAGDVAPDLLAPRGPLTPQQPSCDDERAIARASRLIAALGGFDIGQAAVGTPEAIVAVEGVRGTDAMLRDLGPSGCGRDKAVGGILVKLPKPGQEMRIDLPTIGPDTVLHAAEAGLRGIAIAAGATIVLERQRVVEEAASAGLFVTAIAPSPVRSPGEPAGGAIAEPVLAPLQLVSRRAPTPADRRDIATARRLMAVMRPQQAGRAAIVARDHVLAVSGALPVAAVVAALGRPSSWGRRALRGRIGVLLIDGAGAPAGRAASDILDGELFGAAVAAGLAGLVLLGRMPTGDAREAMVHLAKAAGVFLMAEPDPA